MWHSCLRANEKAYASSLPANPALGASEYPMQADHGIETVEAIGRETRAAALEIWRSEALWRVCGAYRYCYVSPPLWCPTIV